MERPMPTWLTTDLNLLITDITQLRLHLTWLREDLALLPPSLPDQRHAAEELASTLEQTGAALADLTRTLVRQGGSPVASASGRAGDSRLP